MRGWRHLGTSASALLVVILMVVTVTGCWGKRDPVPEHTVTVTADPNRYQFDGQIMAYDQVQAELQAIADKYRRGATGNARVYIKIITNPGADYGRVGDLVDWCASIGLDKIETTGR